MKLFGIVICCLCVNYAMGSESYKAGVMQGQNEEINTYTHFIHDAGKKGVDILVLPSLESSEAIENYDETIKTISSAAKEAGLYVAVHMFEKILCQLGSEVIRSNLVFDREGSVVAVYRKPLNGLANCTTLTPDLVTFTTDFGVTFGLLMEEDMVLHDVTHMRGLKNFVMVGSWHSEIPVLSAAQFSSSWAYTNNANLLSTSGIYSGKAGLRTGEEELATTDLRKNGEIEKSSVSSVIPSMLNHSSEDLSQYVIRPLDIVATNKGLKNTVCHRSFCCNFYVKTDVTGVKPKGSYVMAAFDGVRRFSSNQNIGVQSCGLFACLGDENNCGSQSQNNTSILFEIISIAANFTKHNAQYPIIQSTAVLPTEKFIFDTKTDGISKQVTLEITNSQSIVNFGILGRDFTKDFESNFVYGEKNNTKVNSDIYDFIFNEDVQEFVDYIWIRLRVVIVVVSIYILEMM